MKRIIIALFSFLFFQTSFSFSNMNNGEGIYADQSNLLTPNFATPAFRKRLDDYPGVIVSSIMLRSSGALIPKTLRENGVKLSPQPWIIADLRDVNECMVSLMAKK
ncbi:hypothetical protein [Chromobacterium piscinae]|uniref:hypothetical protein n=1 Tax=Chromobacterium piscinae TaxID=686831 RepID=UPI001C8C0E0F|nr:hypothetical protein [Chromobacterium piscinae]MBX9295032.1 hypothetical protein [Chromobacterium vaccinii]MBX9347770.1 hypothetical protein [Chromobacterium vaccinii]MBX9356969.1 hypothetical protein [Chromobacterium vaccinii]MCD4506583.1 hypothetical protein [Chromobacterium piscinae]